MNNSSITYDSLKVQGNLLQVHMGQDARRGGGRRGRCSQTLTPQSRKRLTEKMLTMDWQTIQRESLSRFITLTTPPEYWDQLETVYNALDKFRRLLFLRGMQCAIVRKEYGKKSGMLHYHLIVFVPRGKQAGFPPECPEDKIEGWCGSAWREFLKCDRRVRVKVEIPDNWDAVQRYITKYCAKFTYNDVEIEGSVLPECLQGEALPLSMSHNAEISGTEKVKSHNGRRLWYVWGADAIPWATEKEVELFADDLDFAYRLKRIFRKITRVRVRRDIMRRELASLGFQSRKEVYSIPDSEIETVYFRLYGEKARRHIARKVQENSVYRNLCRGGFCGFSFWLNERDFEILKQLKQEFSILEIVLSEEGRTVA